MLVLSLHDLHLYQYFRITHTVNHLRSNKTLITTLSKIIILIDFFCLKKHKILTAHNYNTRYNFVLKFKTILHY